MGPYNLDKWEFQQLLGGFIAVLHVDCELFLLSRRGPRRYSKSIEQLLINKVSKCTKCFYIQLLPTRDIAQ